MFNDEGVKPLFRDITLNPYIRKLNLSRNFISDAIPLCKMLSQNKSVVELYLHWNSFHGPAGALIAKSLHNTNKLRILDLSYNSLGLGGPKCAIALGEYLMSQDVSLVHLDLSYN